MNRFNVTNTSIPGVKLIGRARLGDQRGFFERVFCDQEMSNVLGGRSVVQINRTFTVREGAVRGLHFQHPPHAEMKIVTCLKGEIFDVSVDLRRGSPSFLQWHAEKLRARDNNMLVVPEGFAHGFQALTSDCELMYLHTAHFEPTAEDGLNALDPTLAINWPLAISDLSDRDKNQPLIDASFLGLAL
jgi:dTDP-4-dehydrorhamnose 3,5-epimerase